MTNIQLLQDSGACYHGGAFWDVIGDELKTLHLRDRIIAADVLDAWFDPAPAVLEAVADVLPFALRASPPTNARGMERVIAGHRGVPAESVLAGGGSSDLIFAGLRHFLHSGSRVLILDPMYGEYAHVLERVIGAKVERLNLDRDENYDLSIPALRARVARGYDWVILVNPNSPTGRHANGDAIMEIAAGAPRTCFWIDETYIDYVDARLSVERLAATSSNVVVCKSMSKAYALSGARAAYLCGAAAIISDLRDISPPWGISLPAQIAACEAIAAKAYYEARWRETSALRETLANGLRDLGCDVVPGCANFLLCELSAESPPAAVIAQEARECGLLIRDVGNMGRRLGARAFRIAVKDRATNARMLEILGDVLQSRRIRAPEVAWTT